MLGEADSAARPTPGHRSPAASAAAGCLISFVCARRSSDHMLGQAGSAPNPWALDRELGAPTPVAESVWGPLPAEAWNNIATIVGSARGLATDALTSARACPR